MLQRDGILNEMNIQHECDPWTTTSVHQMGQLVFKAEQNQSN
jgi:hypothetical protein